MKRGSMAFVSDPASWKDEGKAGDRYKVDGEDPDGPKKHMVIEIPTFMKSSASATVAKHEAKGDEEKLTKQQQQQQLSPKQTPPQRKRSVFRRFSDALFGHKDAPPALEPLQDEPDSPSRPAPRDHGHHEATIEEGDEEEESEEEVKAQDEKDMAFLLSDNDGPVTVEEIDGEKRRDGMPQVEEEIDKKNEEEPASGSPPTKKKQDEEEVEKTASEDSDADSEEDKDAEAEKGMSLAERKKKRRKEAKLEQASAPAVEEPKLSRKQMKQQNR